MAEYFQEIALEDIKFINLLAGKQCGEVLLPKNLAVSSSMFPFGYSENTGWLSLRNVNANCFIAALA